MAQLDRASDSGRQLDSRIVIRATILVVVLADDVHYRAGVASQRSRAVIETLSAASRSLASRDQCCELDRAIDISPGRNAVDGRQVGGRDGACVGQGHGEPDLEDVLTLAGSAVLVIVDLWWCGRSWWRCGVSIAWEWALLMDMTRYPLS